MNENGIKFTNIYIISQSLEQEKYRKLEEIFSQLPEINLKTYTTCEITLKDIPKGSLIIFDDVKHECNITQFFSMGRHRNLNSFYLCQTYTKIPKQMIRDNDKFLIIFNKDDLNLKHIFNNHVGNDFIFNEFKDFCYQCWQE